MLISLYLLIAIACAVLLVIMMFFADFGGDFDSGFDLGADIDMDAGADIGYGDFGGPGISPLSVPVILVFGTVFGGVGAILEGLGWDEVVVPFVAGLAAAGVSGTLFVLLVKVFVKTQATTQVDAHALVGRDAETTMPVGPDGPGQIMIVTEERGRTLYPAYSDDAIPSNTIVRLVGIEGNGFMVETKRTPKRRSKTGVGD